MTKAELLSRLGAILEQQDDREEYYDIERDHKQADEALLAFIADPSVTELYHAISKWYA